METRPDIARLPAEQLRELALSLYAELEERDGLVDELLGKQGELTLAAVKKERALKRELTAARTEAEMWKEKCREMEKRALVAEARLEEKEHAQPMTIIYGNHATPVYGNNSTNHNPKNDMNIENFYNNGEIKQMGDGNTMNVYEARQQEATLTPTQERAREALITLSTEGRWEKQQWWAVWKVMMSLRLVNKSAREFADYLVDLGVTADNVYNNIYKLDAEFRNISTVNATEWQQYNGRYGDKYQKQIDTAGRLLALLAE